MTNYELKDEWSQVLKPTSNPFEFNFKELWRYRDLIILLVKRDFITVYKQTILGPIWHFIQPLFTSLVYVIFGSFAKIPTDELPRVLFCLTGVVLWNYFSSCLTKTSSTFVGNAHIFGKVYFPRLAIPVSIVISNLMSSFIQFLLLIPFLIYYQENIHPNIFLALTPLIIILVAMMGLYELKVVICPTVREPDGLAMSSRNRRLTETQRARAGVIYQCLVSIESKRDTSDFSVVQKECMELLVAKGFVVDYVALAHARTLQPAGNYLKGEPMVALIAARIGEIRLIDNMVF